MRCVRLASAGCTFDEGLYDNANRSHSCRHQQTIGRPPLLNRIAATPLALAALSVFVSPAHAQQAPASSSDDGKVQTLPTVTVRASADASADGLKPPYAGGQVARGGRIGVLGSQDLMDTPFSTTNYTQKLIQDSQAASIGDVLLNDPAVRVARGFGNYQQTYIVRGLPVFSDDMAYNGLYGLLPRQYLAAEGVERVEVLRGASAFLNGAAPGGSGLGGAINVMPKRAPNEALNEITLGVESGGQGYVAADFARRFGPDKSTGLRLNLVRRDGGTAVDDVKRELSVASLGFDFRSGKLRVSADVGYQDHQLKATQPSITVAAGLAIPTPPDASRNVAQPWTFSNERDTFGTLRAQYDIAPEWTAWGAYGMRRGDERTDLSNPTLTDAAGTLSSYRFVGSRIDRISTGELGVRGKFKTGSVGHTLIASAASYHAKSEAPFGFSDFGPAFLGTIASNLYAPVAVAPPSAAFFTGQTDSDTRTSSVALADTLSLLNDSLLVTLGARHQAIKDGDYDKSRVTPVAGVVFKLSKAVSLYGSHVEGLVKGDTAPATVGALAVDNVGEVFAPYQACVCSAGRVCSRPRWETTTRSAPRSSR
jgi:iron complex outermembrane receptor protein